MPCLSLCLSLLVSLTYNPFACRCMTVSHTSTPQLTLQRLFSSSRILLPSCSLSALLYFCSLLWWVLLGRPQILARFLRTACPSFVSVGYLTPLPPGFVCYQRINGRKEENTSRRNPDTTHSHTTSTLPYSSTRNNV